MTTRFYDNTKLSEFETCRRKYYFRHVRGWTGEMTSPPLVFGASWHSAMDVVWDGICWRKVPAAKDLELAKEAFHEGFMRTWIEEGFPDLENIDADFEDFIKFRSPSTAARMLYDYIKKWRPWLEREVELLTIEQPFAVPLYPDDTSIFYCGRQDKKARFRSDGKIHAIEHKTTTLYATAGGFRDQFLDSFSPNSQVDGYNYDGHMEHPGEFKDVVVDAALVHGKVSAFEHIHVEKKLDHLDSWLHETRAKVEDLESEVRRHEDYLRNPEQTRYMPTFRKDTNRCFDFNSRCAFLDVCQSGDNPATINHTPIGFKVDFWSPFDVLQLEKLGFEQEEGE